MAKQLLFSDEARQKLLLSGAVCRRDRLMNKVYLPRNQIRSAQSIASAPYNSRVCHRLRTFSHQPRLLVKTAPHLLFPVQISLPLHFFVIPSCKRDPCKTA